MPQTRTSIGTPSSALGRPDRRRGEANLGDALPRYACPSPEAPALHSPHVWALARLAIYDTKGQVAGILQARGLNNRLSVGAGPDRAFRSEYTNGVGPESAVPRVVNRADLIASPKSPDSV
jgi:hypothetical protein